MRPRAAAAPGSGPLSQRWKRRSFELRREIDQLKQELAQFRKQFE